MQKLSIANLPNYPREDWSMSAAAIDFLEEVITKQDVQSVLECGSGKSTSRLAELKRRGVIQHWVSLENHEHFYRRTQSRLKPDEQENLIHAPLRMDADGLWYCLEGLENWHRYTEDFMPFELVFVDSPKGAGTTIHKGLRQRLAAYTETPLLILNRHQVEGILDCYEECELLELLHHDSLMSLFTT